MIDEGPWLDIWNGPDLDAIREMSADDLGAINAAARQRASISYVTGFRPDGGGPGSTPFVLVQFQPAKYMRLRPCSASA